MFGIFLFAYLERKKVGGVSQMFLRKVLVGLIFYAQRDGWRGSMTQPLSGHGHLLPGRVPPIQQNVLPVFACGRWHSTRNRSWRA